MKTKCPKCGTLNEDNYPLEVAGKIIEGGCQDCWEKQCDDAWWELGRLIESELELVDSGKRMSLSKDANYGKIQEKTI